MTHPSSRHPEPTENCHPEPTKNCHPESNKNCHPERSAAKSKDPRFPRPTNSIHRTILISLTITLAFILPQAPAQPHSPWHAATIGELEAALPARAPVEKERIETEMRTASGIVGPHGKLIAGVVLITAGYSADGKYSHYLLVQSPITIAGIPFPPGAYVFGWQRTTDALSVHFYEAATGTERGTATARLMPPGTRVESFRLWPPTDRSALQIGRFSLPYHLGD